MPMWPGSSRVTDSVVIKQQKQGHLPCPGKFFTDKESGVGSLTAQGGSPALSAPLSG